MCTHRETVLPTAPSSTAPSWNISSTKKMTTRLYPLQSFSNSPQFHHLGFLFPYFIIIGVITQKINIIIIQKYEGSHVSTRLMSWHSKWTMPRPDSSPVFTENLWALPIEECGQSLPLRASSPHSNTSNSKHLQRRGCALSERCSCQGGAGHLCAGVRGHLHLCINQERWERGSHSGDSSWWALQVSKAWWAYKAQRGRSGERQAWHRRETKVPGLGGGSKRR